MRAENLKIDIQQSCITLIREISSTFEKILYVTLKLIYGFWSNDVLYMSWKLYPTFQPDKVNFSWDGQNTGVVY